MDMDPGSVMLGINNRDLQTFKVDLQNNQRIMDSPAGQEVGTAVLGCPESTKVGARAGAGAHDHAFVMASHLGLQMTRTTWIV